MQEDTTPPATPADGQSCGCSCEHCAAGDHEQCQTGMCTMKKPAAPADDQNGGAPAA